MSRKMDSAPTARYAVLPSDIAYGAGGQSSFGIKVAAQPWK